MLSVLLPTVAVYYFPNNKCRSALLRHSEMERSMEQRSYRHALDSKQITDRILAIETQTPPDHIILKLTHVLGRGKKGSCSLPALHLPKILASNRKW